MIEYKGYVAVVEFDDQADCFHGEVANIDDVVTFEGRTADDVRQAFHDSVDDYLEFCAEREETPDLPGASAFLVHVEPALRASIAARAEAAGKSLDGWVRDVLAAAAR